MFFPKYYSKQLFKNDPHLPINLIFAFFPISFILGSFVVNLNLLLFCFYGVYLLRSKILNSTFNLPIKIIFLFFFTLFLSTALNLIQSLYFGEYDSANLVRLVKSILFFRFFLFLITIYLLSKFDILRFKYLLLTATFSSILLSLDVAYQHYFGFDILGLKSVGHRNPGFFGDESVAGGYLLRFGFFAIFFTILVFKKKNYTRFISTVIVICILATGILFSGNRMPLILFIFGLFLLFLPNLKIKKILLLSLVVLAVLFKFIISSDESYKSYLANYYSSYIEEIENTFLTPFDINFHRGKGIQTWARKEKIDEEELVLGEKSTFYKNVKIRSSYLRFGLAALNTWKSNKIFGNGIKSFYTDCHKLSSDPNIRIEEDQFPDKENLLCSNHPHNYYFQILTTTGIVGLFITFLIGWSFLVFIFKNFKFIKKINMTNIILLSVIISFFLEMFPLRNTGSLYTTNNATYIILIGSIILSYKELLKVK